MAICANLDRNKSMHIIEASTLSEPTINKLIEKVDTKFVTIKNDPPEIILENSRYSVIFFQSADDNCIATIAYKLLNVTREYRCEKSFYTILEIVSEKTDNTENNKLAEKEIIDSFSPQFFSPKIR